jgi:hypothetical protein
MVVNFRARGISRSMRKLARTHTLIIKKNIQVLNKRKGYQQHIKPDKFIVGEMGILKPRKMILKEENFERKQVQTQF